MDKILKIKKLREYLGFDKLTVTGLIHYIFSNTWSSHPVLYTNMDETFNSFATRNRVSDEDKQIISNLDVPFNQETIDYVLSLALTKADYHTTRKFYWTFQSVGRNKRNLTAYTEQTEHEYMWLHPLIDLRFKELDEQGLGDWRFSTDVDIHKYFHQTLERIRKNKSNLIYFVEKWHGDNAFNTFSPFFKHDVLNLVIDYVKEKHIVPDYHDKHSGLEYRPQLNAFSKLGYTVKYSVPNSHHEGTDLFYLTSFEIQELFNEIFTENNDVLRFKNDIDFLCSRDDKYDPVKFYVLFRIY